MRLARVHTHTHTHTQIHTRDWPCFLLSHYYRDTYVSWNHRRKTWYTCSRSSSCVINISSGEGELVYLSSGLDLRFGQVQTQTELHELLISCVQMVREMTLPSSKQCCYCMHAHSIMLTLSYSNHVFVGHTYTHVHSHTNACSHYYLAIVFFLNMHMHMVIQMHAHIIIQQSCF